MTDKLTKEQADWLIEKIKVDAQAECFGGGELKYSEVVERTINQCTEKEFPKFEIDLFQAASTNMFVDIPYDATVRISSHPITREPVLMMKNKETICTARFNLAQFKEFIECIDKILEYLNEQ